MSHLHMCPMTSITRLISLRAQHRLVVSYPLFGKRAEVNSHESMGEIARLNLAHAVIGGLLLCHARVGGLWTYFRSTKVTVLFYPRWDNTNCKIFRCTWFVCELHRPFLFCGEEKKNSKEERSNGPLRPK